MLLKIELQKLNFKLRKLKFRLLSSNIKLQKLHVKLLNSNVKLPRENLKPLCFMHELLRDSIEANWEYVIPICFTCKAKSLKLEAIRLRLEVFWDSVGAKKLNRILIRLSGDSNKGECEVYKVDLSGEG